MSKFVKLSNGRAFVNHNGSLIVQQGKPFGSICVPGEVHLNSKDITLLNKMLAAFLKDNQVPKVSIASLSAVDLDDETLPFEDQKTSKKKKETERHA